MITTFFLITLSNFYGIIQISQEDNYSYHLQKIASATYLIVPLQAVTIISYKKFL
jgi:hypothetical protein